MSLKSRLAKLEKEMSPKKLNNLSDAEKARLKNMCEAYDAFLGKIPMTPELQERIDKIGKERLGDCAFKINDERSYLRAMMDFLY